MRLVNTLAWNSKIGLVTSFEGVCAVRDYKLGYTVEHSYQLPEVTFLDRFLTKICKSNLPRMFSLIKNESEGIEDDQIPS